MRILKPSMAAAVALLLWLEPTHAQVLTSVVAFGPQAGISKARGEDANVIFGAALRFRLFPALGLEGSINYRQEEFAGDALTVRSWPIQVTGMLYPVPFAYGAMGAGWYMTTFDYGGLRPVLNDETNSEFGWHFGGGIELPLANTAKLVGDLRYVFLDYHFDAVPGSSDIDDDFYMATAGLLFNL
jgi:Outer membrane protein beta-barrel domain